MSSQAKRQADSSDDFVTEYAELVLDEKIIAGPHVRDACKRHINDLIKAPNRGFFFDKEIASWVIQYFREVLFLNGGEYEGVPFDPILWQKFIIGSVYGWVNKEGYRRFRMAYVETSKGSGKSPLAAGIGMYGLTADGENRAEIYAAATKKDQAMILFRDAVAMTDLSPELSARLTKSGRGEQTWNLAYRDTGSFFRPIASDDAQSGPRPHVALLDEIHEHKSETMVEMMRAGTKGRKQALIFMITNSGYDKNTVAWHYHDYATKVAAGSIHDDSFFSYVCALDDNDDPFKDEGCWIKTNPSLGITIPPQYLREQVTQARGMPSKESIVRRLNFSQWVGAEAPWISPEIWAECQDDYTLESLAGRKCYGGLDLSSTQDLTSLVLVFEPTIFDPYYRLWPYFWLPDDNLHQKSQKDGVDYLGWQRDGHIETTPGSAINKRFVLRKMMEACSIFDLQVIAVDRWRLEDIEDIMEDEGIDIPMVAHGQGFKDMGFAVDDFEGLLLNKTIKHPGNPCLTWNAGNTVIVSDDAGLRKPTKKRSTGRIDGIVAGIMGVRRALLVEPDNIDDFINNPVRA